MHLKVASQSEYSNVCDDELLTPVSENNNFYETLKTFFVALIILFHNVVPQEPRNVFINHSDALFKSEAGYAFESIL